METKELDNLSRTELFELFKAKCKSNAKRGICIGLIVLLSVVYILFTNWQRPDDTKSIIFFIFQIVIGCISGWAVLNNYLLLKRIDNLDTPDQLLYHLEKTHRYNLIGLFVLFIFFTGWFFVRGSDFIDYVSGAICLVATVAILFCIFYKNSARNWLSKERRKQLQEHVEKK